MARIATTIGWAAAAVSLAFGHAWSQGERASTPAALPLGLSASYTINLAPAAALPSLAASAVPALAPAASIEAPSGSAAAARVGAMAETAAKIAAPIAAAASGSGAVSDEAMRGAGADLGDMRASAGGDAVAAPSAAPAASLEQRIAAAQPLVKDYFQEVGKRMIGQEEAISLGLVSLLAEDGHVLFVGVPGLAKSRLAKAVGEVSGIAFHRIQMTSDMMPADIRGYEEKDSDGKITIKKGPIFKAPLILADEVNRATPRAKSAVLEPMAERQVSIGDETFPLSPLFTVWGTMNPLGTKGTYPLDEAEADRFLVSIMLERPSFEQEKQIADMRSRGKDLPLKQVFSADKILELRETIKAISISEALKDYSIQIIRATDPTLENSGFDTKGFVERGANVRGSIAIQKVARVRAFMENRAFVTADDIQWAALYVLRHRIDLSTAARARKMKPEDIIKDILHGPRAIPVPAQ